jgi:gluconate 5-dehydrogenase
VEQLTSEGIHAFGYRFDITRKEEVETTVGVIEKEVGPIDVLINNAGIQKRTPLEDFPEAEWDTLIEINLKGVLMVSKYVARYMIKRKHGKIINICSLQSELGRETIAPYAASKGGVKMLTRAMAVEWAKHNIQVNGIGPGYFITELTQPLAENKEFDSWLKARTPAGRWGDPKELIGPALFLSSEASSFVNGQVLYIDGGILAAI